MPSFKAKSSNQGNHLLLFMKPLIELSLCTQLDDLRCNIHIFTLHDEIRPVVYVRVKILSTCETILSL